MNQIMLFASLHTWDWLQTGRLTFPADLGLLDYRSWTESPAESPKTPSAAQLDRQAAQLIFFKAVRQLAASMRAGYH